MRIQIRTFFCLVVTLLLCLLSMQTQATGIPVRPADIDESDWAALEQAVAKSVTPQAKLTGQGSAAGADGAAGDLFGSSVAVSGDTAIFGAPSDNVGGVASHGSAYVFIRSGTAWNLQAKLTPIDGDHEVFFGRSVALSGDTALIGASGSSAVYAFVRSGSTWSQQAKLAASDGGTNDGFGYSIALSGDTALVGASNDSVGFLHQGSAYVFTRSGTVWSQQAKLTASDAASDDWFGNSVALSDNTALIGSVYDDMGSANQGSAYVFVRSGALWNQQAKLSADDGAAGDFFGRSVGLSGDTALVGASADDSIFVNQGSVYVFNRTDSDWSQQAKLTAGDGAENDRFGASLAVSGETALVGSTYVFVRNGVVWGEQARLTTSDGSKNDGFGSSVALSGDTVVVGRSGNDQDPGDRGSAYVFVRGGTVWDEQAKVTAGEGATGTAFGYSVAISGDTALVGAPGTSASVGYAYVFTRSGGVWTEQAKLAASDGVAGDRFGFSVALLGDNAVVGAPYRDVGFNDQGSAYVFKRDGTTWNLQANLVAGDGATADQFGHAVAIFGDTALVGAPIGGAIAGRQGTVYVFTRSDATWAQEAKLIANDGVASDRFGYSVALSGDTALIGAQFNSAVFYAHGAAYIFTRSGTTWGSQSKLMASDAAYNGRFGYSVALSGDTALVGSKRGGASLNQGAAYVFARDDVVWSEQAKLTASDGTENDGFGDSVALSGDTALVGERASNDVFLYQGAAYAFTRMGSVWLQQIKFVANDAAVGGGFGNAVALDGVTALVGAAADNGLPPFGNPGEGSAYVFDPVEPVGIFIDSFEPWPDK